MIFGAFERMVAFRYLRARRQEGFVSVIAIFSLLGIALGVATLIIVMSVMNGFRADLIGRILGLNGHLGVYGETGMLTDFDAVAGKVRQVPGVVSATPMIEGQVMATGESGAASGAIVRSYGMDPSIAPYWVGLDLVGDGTFWATDKNSTYGLPFQGRYVYRFDLATGAVLQSFSTGTTVVDVVVMR